MSLIIGDNWINNLQKKDRNKDCEYICIPNLSISKVEKELEEKLSNNIINNNNYENIIVIVKQHLNNYYFFSEELKLKQKYEKIYIIRNNNINNELILDRINNILLFNNELILDRINMQKLFIIILERKE